VKLTLLFADLARWKKVWMFYLNTIPAAKSFSPFYQVKKELNFLKYIKTFLSAFRNVYVKTENFVSNYQQTLENFCRFDFFCTRHKRNIIFTPIPHAALFFTYLFISN
jgi:hypothetical protein